MKSNYEQTLEKNFNRALELCSNAYSYETLIKFLKNGNIVEKQYAALTITELKSQDDANIFISNLINCDGKIREVVAQKITEFMLNEKYRQYFSQFPEVFAKSTIDINANISRMVIDSLFYLNNFREFGEKYAEQLLIYIQEAFDGLDKIVFRDKKYTVNKQLFKLYWCLEGLFYYSLYIDENIIKEIIEKAFEISEYTVREKAARLLLKYSDNPLFSDLLSKIDTDVNYYVKNSNKASKR